MSVEERALLMVDSSGRQVSLLNDAQETTTMKEGQVHQGQRHRTPSWDSTSSPDSSPTDHTLMHHWPHAEQQAQSQEQQQQSVVPKRKYHCTAPGCQKSFTTSGHLARHHRIHTGEKNFRCLFPECQSRFSRQDNMMQHYRTHLAPKSKRAFQRKQIAEEPQLRPRLHAHHRILSGPYRHEPPLTIDQHLSNYYQHSMPPVLDVPPHPPINAATGASPIPPPSGSDEISGANKDNLFYRHRPLHLPPITAPAGQVFTLLHPPTPSVSESPRPSASSDEDAALVKLAHVVSTFG